MKRPLLAVALGIVVALPSVKIAHAFFGGNKPSKVLANSLWTELPPEDATRMRINIPSLAPLVKRSEPAVLVVTTEAVVKQDPRGIPPGFGPFGGFFPFFSPNGQMPERHAKGQGSGFMIHPSGLALTNYHVVEGATSISVKVGSSLKTYQAEVVGSDADNDVALIKLKSDKKDWPVIPLGNSAAAEIGDFAVAIGNPLGLELSVSMGIISQRGRRDVHPSGRSGLYDFMQISVPINPGNSGGPLLNLAGEVIGINTAVSAGGQGIAFTIPIDQVKRILPQLKETGSVKRSYLGVRIQNVSPEVAKAMGLPYAQGALVSEVVAGSPAHKAGILAGDIIMEFDGKVVDDASSLQVMAGLAGVGKSFPLSIVRTGKTKMVKITLEALPKNDKAPSANATPGQKTTLEDLGVALGNANNGVSVVEVAPQSIAALAGIEAGDVIVQLNDKPVKSVAAFVDMVKAVPKDGVLQIYLKRGQATIFVAFQKP